MEDHGRFPAAPSLIRLLRLEYTSPAFPSLVNYIYRIHDDDSIENAYLFVEMEMTVALIME